MLARVDLRSKSDENGFGQIAIPDNPALFNHDLV